MHTRFITISAGALLLAATSPAMSHHPSGTGTSSTGGPIVTIPGTTLQKGASALYFVFEHMSFDELSDAVLEAAAEKDQHAHSLATLESPALGYSYGLTDRLMVSVQLPYVVRTGIREASHHHDEAEEEHSHAEAGATEEHEHESGEEHEEESETVDRGDTDGIGDLTLFGQYRFYGQDTGLQASLLTGIKTPTGKTGERDDQGELFEAEFQPGSGSWDPMLGLALTRAQGRWSVDGNVLYTIATEGTQHTDLGDRFHYNGAVTYRLKGGDAEAAHERNAPFSQWSRATIMTMRMSPTGLVIDAVLELNGEWQAKQNVSGETDPNSGGNVVFLSPGVRVASNRWSGFVTVGLPIVNDLNGLQSEPTYRLFGGVLVGF